MVAQLLEAVFIWVLWGMVAATIAVMLWCVAVTWAQMRVARQQYQREQQERRWARHAIARSIGLEYKLTQRDARELAEIAELELSWQMPTAPSSPFFRRI